MSARFDPVRGVADAVLLEGYVLYPYRASSRKNQFRFAFGVLAPRGWSEAGGCEPWWCETQCLIEGESPRVEGALRFLRVVRRRVEQALAGGSPRATDRLEAGGRLHVPWDEGELREVTIGPLALAQGGGELELHLEGGLEEEIVRDEDGAAAGRVVRDRAPLSARVVARAEPLEAASPLWQLSIRVENLGEGHGPGEPRDAVLPASLASTHLMLACERGAFVSLVDPPAWAREAAERCASVRCHPVLAGPEGARDLLLSAPIILPDHPRIAPESPGDFFDAGEIDELLVLRTANLTDAEKREVRATDARAAAIVDRVDALAPEAMERLHGAIRERRVLGEGARFAPGDKVRLRPGPRRTDAQDLLYAGRVATVEEVREDIDGREHLLVTIDDDPARELHRWYGRFHYYYPDEVEPLEGER